MPEITDLLVYGAQVRPPGLDELERVAVRRRRRAATVGAAATALTVVAVVAVTGLLGSRQADTAPVAPVPSLTRSTSPSPTPTPGRRTTGAIPALTPEEIRRHPDASSYARDLPATGAPGVGARIWEVCLDDCTRATEHVPGEIQQALEVSRDDFATGALYALDLSENISHVVDDWYLVDSFDGAMLVNSRQERRPVTRGSPVAVTEISGPPVYSRQGLAFLDIGARELHLIEGAGSWDWQGAVDSWFWGTASLVADVGDTPVTRHAALWRNPDGTFELEVLPIGESMGGAGMLRGGPPGTMAVVEHFAYPRLAHISTDYGATWQTRLVPDEVPSGGRLPVTWTSWAPG